MILGDAGVERTPKKPHEAAAYSRSHGCRYEDGECPRAIRQRKEIDHGSYRGDKGRDYAHAWTVGDFSHAGFDGYGVADGCNGCENGETRHNELRQKRQGFAMQCGFYEKAAVDCSQVEDAEDPGKKKAPAKPRRRKAHQGIRG